MEVLDNSDNSESSFLKRTIYKTNKCVFQCYLCLTCPCFVVSLIKFIKRM